MGYLERLSAESGRLCSYSHKTNPSSSNIIKEIAALTQPMGAAHNLCLTPSSNGRRRVKMALKDYSFAYTPVKDKAAFVPRWQTNPYRLDEVRTMIATGEAQGVLSRMVSD